jgi:two-component system phosphate regulon sensor histidine kinase PhoR
MISPQRYFPWKIGRHFLFKQMSFAFVVLVIAAFSIRYYAYNLFAEESVDIPSALGHFDRYLTGLFCVLFSVLLIFEAYVTKLYFQPLGRLIQRARELRRPGAPIVEIYEEDLTEEEPGEWFDLERALNRIHKELRLQTYELEHEREELSALIGAVSDAILAVEKTGQPLFYNSQFALLFGLQNSPRKATRLSEIFRVPEILNAFAEVLETGQRVNVQTTIHTSRDAMARHFSISVAPLRSKDDAAVYGAVGIFHDVTELKQAEQIRIEFVGNASHELRTPLTSIKGYLDTVRSDFKTGRLDDVEKFLEIISRNVDRLIFLVNDLLDLSTIESGAELKKSSVNFREITESILKQLEEHRASKRQEIVTQFIKGETVHADPRRVEQVLVNLVDNAIKYIPEGHRIEIIWDQDPIAGTTLRVRDNGTGVPLEHQSRLFERFYRIDTGRSRDQGGTGLGLAIVKHIMLKHGGSVQLKSRPGEGSEFICTFP